jgi:serine/threonine protein kinase
LYDSGALIGKTLRHYEITAKLGEGGMGEVYRASDSRLNRDVAIKVLPAALTEDTERLARFEREAQVLASLNHPNIAAIYGLEQADAQWFLVLELVEGVDLAESLAEGPLAVSTAFGLADQAGDGMPIGGRRARDCTSRPRRVYRSLMSSLPLTASSSRRPARSAPR